MLEDLPHVGAVIYAEDNERLIRLIRQLRALVDDRAERYGKVNAGSIDEYRTRTNQPNEARIIVLVDNFAAFRLAYEMGPQSRWFEVFQALATEGRVVGVHMVISVDRPGSIPTGLGSAIQRKLVLRLSNEMDYAMLNAPADVFTATSPPGGASWTTVMCRLLCSAATPTWPTRRPKWSGSAAPWFGAGAVPVVKLASLSDRIVPSDLPASVGGKPVLGVWDETLAPIGFDPMGVFVITGPPQSGKTNAAAWLVKSVAAATPGSTFALFGTRRSPLATLTHWAHQAHTPDDMEQLANDLAKLVSSEDPSVASLVVVVESIGELLNGAADQPLQDLLRGMSRRWTDS